MPGPGARVRHGRRKRRRRRSQRCRAGVRGCVPSTVLASGNRDLRTGYVLRWRRSPRNRRLLQRVPKVGRGGLCRSSGADRDDTSAVAAARLRDRTFVRHRVRWARPPVLPQCRAPASGSARTRGSGPASRCAAASTPAACHPAPPDRRRRPWRRSRHHHGTPLPCARWPRTPYALT